MDDSEPQTPNVDPLTTESVPKWLADALHNDKGRTTDVQRNWILQMP